MLYFTYGSFLNMENLIKHCPSATFFSRAILPNFEVRFNYMSEDYQTGVTGAEFAPGKLAYGVLYDIPREEIENKLDVVESVPEGYYYRQTVMVVKENGEPVQAECYHTTEPKGPFKSNRTYVRHMLKGAKEHGLNSDYINELEGLYNSLDE
ncbi:MAG: gamma-glutamylcyclotransferase [bacterium]